MAVCLNRAQIIGNLTRDPEVRQTPQGVSVATFGVATNYTWNDNNGQKQEKAEFHNVVVWRKLAEICAQYLKKGSKVFIEGKMQTRDWTGEDGVKRYKTEIIAENMIMLDRKGDMGDHSGMNYIPNEDRKSQNKINNNEESPVPVEEEVKLEDLPL